MPKLDKDIANGEIFQLVSYSIFCPKIHILKSFQQLELENGCDLFVLLSLSLQQFKKVNVT